MQKRSEKEQAVSELREKLSRAKVAIIAQPKNLDVATVTELRRKFREKKVEYKLVKNTLARRAVKGTMAEPLQDLLVGPTALILGYEDPVSPAKVLHDFIGEKAGRMSVRGGALDGKLIDAQAVEALSKLPGLTELRATIAGMVNRPAQMLASVLAQPSRSLARVIDARREAEAAKS